MPFPLGPSLAVLLLAALAPGPAQAQGIFTCTDAKGRKLTSDRPIMECIDREQKEITPSGNVVRRIGPSLTAEERAAEEEKQRKIAEERARVEDEKKKDRALLNRYPDKAHHDKERAAALVAAEEATAAAQRRVVDLQKERKRLEGEMEFYKNDPKKAPLNLRRNFEETEQQLAAQQRFIANQEEDRRRLNARYDEELARLRGLWAQRAAPVAVRPASGMAK